LSPLVSTAPEERPRPKLDPDSWDAIARIEEFKRQILSQELVYTDIATRVYYVSRQGGLPSRRHWWSGEPKTLLADEINHALLDYQQYKDLHADIGRDPEEVFRKAQKALYWIWNAYAVKAVEPGPGILRKLDEANAERDRLLAQVRELTQKLDECEFKRKHGIGDPHLGDVITP